MKSKKNLLTGLALGGLLGWVIGYVRVPDMALERSFWMGFIATLFLVFLIIAIRLLFKSNQQIAQPLSSLDQQQNSERSANKYLRRWKLISLLMLIGAILLSFFVLRQNKLLKTQIQQQNKNLQKQSLLIDSIRNSNQATAMNNLLDKIDQEIQSSDERRLTKETIDRIAAFSHTFKPYQYQEGDTLSERTYSPERAQLFLALANMNIDSSSFREILKTTDFSNADLRKSTLVNVDLSFSNFTAAEFRASQLDSANFSKANLQDASFWGAELGQADLSQIKAKRANFSWANLYEANLQNAELAGALFKSAKLKRADLRAIKMRWAKLNNALMNETNLEDADMAGSHFPEAVFNKANLRNADIRYTDLTRVDFSEADLRAADLKFATLQEAIFRHTKLDSVQVDNADWFSQLENWKVSGVEAIRQTYEIVQDTSKADVFYLVKITDE